MNHSLRQPLVNTSETSSACFAAKDCKEIANFWIVSIDDENPGEISLPGFEIGELLIHHADGPTNHLPIRFGIEMLDWKLSPRERERAYTLKPGPLDIAWEAKVLGIRVRCVAIGREICGCVKRIDFDLVAAGGEALFALAKAVDLGLEGFGLPAVFCFIG